MVVTGRRGQLVSALVERASAKGAEIVPLGRPELELADPEARIVDAIRSATPDVVIAAAAYTQVDKAEAEPELAFSVNEGGARAVARAACALDVPLIYVSTDYVFDGTKDGPYVEQDPTRPATVYGASKLAGEQAVLSEHSNSAILRTAWVYSPFGANFVKTMLRLAGEQAEVSVVADQCGNPTSAWDIADAVLAVAVNLVNEGDPRLRGIFHMAAASEASWAEFAEAVYVESLDLGGPAAAVKRIATQDYQTAARRPVNSRLDSTRLAHVHGVRLPPWRSSLPAVVQRLVELGF